MLVRAAALLLIASNALAGIAYRFDGTATGSGRVIAEGPKMRVEFLRGERVFSVMISTDGGKTLTTLDPATKTFNVTNVAGLFEAVSLTNAKATARDLGDGGTLEGYPTRKWVVDGSYDLRVGDTPVHFTMHSESWRTERITEDAQLKGSSVAEAMMPANVKGFPLKEVMTIASKGGTVKSTTEVHDVRRVSTTPAMFAVPAGYKRK